MKKKIDTFIEIFLSISLIIMVIAACWQVFTRFILNNPSGITEELLRYMLIWVSMVGAAYAYGQNKHLSIIFIVKKLSEKHQKLLAVVVDLIVILFTVTILLYGGSFTFNIAIGQTSSAMKLPMQYLYLSLIVSGILFLYYSLNNMISSIKTYNALGGK